jgi:hypothetical protein
MGNPSERHEKILVDPDKSPSNPLLSESLAYIQVVDINGIVEIDKLKADHLAENDHDYQY